MATVLFMKDANITFKVGVGVAKAYQGQVASVAVVVEPGSTETYPTLDGTSQSQVGPSSYHLDIRAGQVWDSTTGLAGFLWANEGAVADFTVQAHGQGVAPSAAAPYMSGQVRLVAGSYGGEVGTYAEIEVALPCIAKPVLAATGTLPASLAEGEAEAEAAEAEAAA